MRSGDARAVRAGWEAFQLAEWDDARDAFAAALERDEHDPEALDGLGQALWWLGLRDEAIDRRRDAYAEYRRRGDARSAGRVATYLAGEERIDGRPAAAAGWIARARRLLHGAGRVPEAGWLEIEEAKTASDAAESERHARGALDLAHELGDADVECMALAQLGRALVRQGRVAEGLTCLDEAMTVALGGETSDPLACGDACCTTLVVCDRIADVQRATEWCHAVVEFTERRRFLPVQAWCRAIYGGVLVRAGDWGRADEVLTEALRRHAERRRGGGHAAPLAALADLRLRQGRTDEAETLLAGLQDSPYALAPLVRLNLRNGSTRVARALLERPRPADDDDGLRLVLGGELALAEADGEAAAGLAERLRALAAALRRDDLRAQAGLLAGRAAHALGDHETAARELGEALQGFESVSFPLEAAQARLALAAVQAATGSPLALPNARAARAAFERLGARHDLDEAAALLRTLGVTGRRSARGERGDLTAREREVLDLVAAGLTNAEIARRLVIAPKTAEHHVSRVLGKLGVRSRAEAAAHAAREGL